MPESHTFTARWVFPVSGPPLERGTVTVRGAVIESVDPHGARTADDDLGNVAVIPGLVNAHTHLDLSGARGLIPPTDPDHFTDWLRGVIAYRRGRTPEQVQANIRAGLDECLRAGTTLLGDITAEGASWDAVIEAPVRAVVFRELIGLSTERIYKALADVDAWGRAASTKLFRRGLSPHAPYSASPLLVRVAGGLLPAAIHLAETPGELELIRSGTGPFVAFLQDVGAWNAGVLGGEFDNYIQYLAIRHTGISVPRLYIHANYLDPQKAALFHDQMSIVYCPRTHAAFGHPPHPFREFLARGVRVCLGTDSLASNPDLDILAEARFVHARYPDFPGDVLLKMVTLSGAEALGWADEVGSLEAGKSADFVAVPLPDRDAADPHELLFSEGGAGNRRTMFRGVWRKS